MALAEALVCWQVLCASMQAQPVFADYVLHSFYLGGRTASCQHVRWTTRKGSGSGAVWLTIAGLIAGASEAACSTCCCGQHSPIQFYPALLAGLHPEVNGCDYLLSFCMQAAVALRRCQAAAIQPG